MLDRVFLGRAWRRDCNSRVSIGCPRWFCLRRMRIMPAGRWIYWPLSVSRNCGARRLIRVRLFSGKCSLQCAREAFRYACLPMMPGVPGVATCTANIKLSPTSFWFGVVKPFWPLDGVGMPLKHALRFTLHLPAMLRIALQAGAPRAGLDRMPRTW